MYIYALTNKYKASCGKNNVQIQYKSKEQYPQRRKQGKRNERREVGEAESSKRLLSFANGAHSDVPPLGAHCPLEGAQSYTARGDALHGTVHVSECLDPSRGVYHCYCSAGGCDPHNCRRHGCCLVEGRHCGCSGEGEIVVFGGVWGFNGDVVGVRRCCRVCGDCCESCFTSCSCESIWRVCGVGCSQEEGDQMK